MNTFRKLCALILSLCLLAAVLSPALAEETAGDEVTPLRLFAFPADARGRISQ